MRTLFAVALAATLAGCSQPLPYAQAPTEYYAGASGNTCLERAAGPPIKLMTYWTRSSEIESADAQRTEKPSSAHVGRAHVQAKAAKPDAGAAKAEPPASRVPLPLSSPQLQAAGSSGESRTTDAKIAEPDRTVGATYSNTRTIEAQVTAATVLAERVTAASASPSPDAKNGDGKDLLVVVLMTRPDTKSVVDLTGKTVAIDNRYSASNATVRTALVAAGAYFVELSESQATAINRLVNEEVPAAVVALVSAQAAEGFPEIPGFRIFHIPLSPRSLKERP